MSPAKLSTRKELLRRLNIAKQYVDDNYLEVPAIDAIAKVSTLLQFHFFRNFKEVFGITPFKYMQVKRLEHAKKMLLRQNHKIGDIAIECSFHDPFILDAQFNYQYGNYRYDSWGFVLTGDGAFPSLNHNRKELQRWQKPGDITQVPRYDFGNATNSDASSTRYFYKGDYIRLRNITLGFNLPDNIAKKIGLSKLNFYLRGTNLWTKAFDKNLTIDPEEQINGTNDLQFFNAKSYTAGINIQL